MFHALLNGFKPLLTPLAINNTMNSCKPLLTPLVINSSICRGYAVPKRKLVNRKFVMRPKMKSRYKGNPRPRVKMILLEDVEKLGLKGQIVDAKRGTVHYQLIPNKLAEYATEENLKKHGLALENSENKLNVPLNVMNFLKKQHIYMIPPVPEDIHEETRSDWVITRHDIAEYFHRHSGLQVPIHCMKIIDQTSNEIRSIGEYTVEITLNNLMTIPVPLTVLSRDVLLEEID